MKINKFKKLEEFVSAIAAFTMLGASHPDDMNEIEHNFHDTINKFTNNTLTPKQQKALEEAAKG